MADGIRVETVYRVCFQAPNQFHDIFIMGVYLMIHIMSKLLTSNVDGTPNDPLSGRTRAK